MAFRVKAGKKFPREVATPRANASFVPGSRPPALPGPGLRIKPAAPNTTQYGKPARPIDPMINAPYGSFGQTGTI